MAKINSDKRVIEYAKDFKVYAVKLTERLPVTVVEIAEALDLHPVMVYRRRQEYREGKLIAPPTRKVNMSLDKKTPSKPSAKQLGEMIA